MPLTGHGGLGGMRGAGMSAGSISDDGMTSEKSMAFSAAPTPTARPIWAAASALIQWASGSGARMSALHAQREMIDARGCAATGRRSQHRAVLDQMHSGRVIEIKPVPADPERRARADLHAGNIDEKMADRLAIGRDDRDVIEFHWGTRVGARPENLGCMIQPHTLQCTKFCAPRVILIIGVAFEALSKAS